tara:strand:+ start:2929 stop:3453 length:525 start_codon:yes stop_codon:yes gene_type:complete
MSRTIYRYKFSEEFLDNLQNFCRIHRYDDSKKFKDDWDIWIEENKDIIDMEKMRLKELGYTGNCEKKMYKSARYYFKSKSTGKNEPKKRRPYIGLDREFLDTIDIHIQSISEDNMKPAEALLNFLDKTEYSDIIRNEKLRLKSYNLDDDEIRKKFKKTYKNRYFIMKKKKELIK